MIKYCHMVYLAADIGEVIRQAREAKGWGMSELGRRVGTNHTHIGQIERGEHIVGWDLLAKIADELDLSLDALLGRAAQASAYLAQTEAIAQIVMGLSPKELPAFEDHARVWTNLPDVDRWKLTQVAKVWGGLVHILGAEDEPMGHVRRLRRRDRKDEDAKEG